MNIEELKKHLSETSNVLRLLLRERDDEIAAAVAAAKAAVNARYNDHLRAASAAVSAAQQALDDHIDATASHPWDGKRVYRVEPVRNRYTGRQVGEERLDGIVEVVRQSSQFPDNKRYGLPRLGEVIVRKLKKDGSPSLHWHDSHILRDLTEVWTLAD